MAQEAQAQGNEAGAQEPQPRDVLGAVSAIPFFEAMRVIDFLSNMGGNFDELKARLVAKLSEQYGVSEAVLGKMSVRSLYKFFASDVERHLALLKAIDGSLLNAADEIVFEASDSHDHVEVHKYIYNPLANLRVVVSVDVDYDSNEVSAALEVQAYNRRDDRYVVFRADLAGGKRVPDAELLLRYLNAVRELSDP